MALACGGGMKRNSRNNISWRSIRWLFCVYCGVCDHQRLAATLALGVATILA